MAKRKGSAKTRKKGNPSPNEAARESRRAGVRMIFKHPMFNLLGEYVGTWTESRSRCPDEGWALVAKDGYVHLNSERYGEPAEWSYVLAHSLLHLGLGHFQEKERPWEWNAACDCVVARLLSELKLGVPPSDIGGPLDFAERTEEALYRRFCVTGVPESLRGFGTSGPGNCDMLFTVTWPRHKQTDQSEYSKALTRGVARAVRSAVAVAGHAPFKEDPSRATPAQKARRWFMDHYPLLGALAAGFEIVEDRDICRRLDVHVAAVWGETREIYMNPTAPLHGNEEYRFVMAHELLHVGLGHGRRCQGRDPYFWNIACDFVVNGWLVEMGLGDIPRCGGLYDPDLKGQSAEAVYDRIIRNVKDYRKLSTFRGRDLPDILPENPRPDVDPGLGIDLDEFCRRCLAQGLTYHQELGRGYLPLGLVEEIRALSQPPIPWDVELARWFDERFRATEKVRTYARPSRRQSATPDIPRPRWIEPDEIRDSRTYGVVLDTSGSMDRATLAKALGAIASYSISRDVRAARLVFCDAAAYDHGFVAPEEIAGKVKVKGRGGTVLQPGVSLLEKAPDFPKNAPILIITDGMCDHVRTKRDHAFLLPRGASLPFTPKGEVFRVG